METTESNPQSKIRSLNHASSESRTQVFENAGLPFWEKLTPEMWTVIEGPIRETEEMIARQFPDGYSSPLVAKAQSLKDEDHLERQHDVTSCTLVSAANGLRILDQPQVEFSKDALKAQAERLSGRDQPTIDREDLRKIFSEHPYNQFSIRGLPEVRVRLPNTSPEITNLFRLLQSGDIAIAGWRKEPTRVVDSRGEGFINHARTIVGFTKGENNSLYLHVVDPYGARQETWSFRDWIVGMRMNTLFDNPLYSAEDVEPWVKKMNQADELMANIAKDVWVIHKKRPKIVLPQVK